MSDLLSQNTTLYFGYGSNLWLSQMHSRCPQSTYSGLARLPSYRWQINSRGYANVVELSTPVVTSPTTKINTNSDNNDDDNINYKNVVYGLVYTLPPADEARLDKNEGVPHAYTKEYIEVDFWASTSTPTSTSTTTSTTTTNDTSPNPIDTEAVAPVKKKVLVYIDRKRVEDDVPKEEYVYRINMGVRDALRLGVPEDYFEEVVRKFIPKEEGEEGEGGVVDGRVEQIAFKQAMEFEDGL